MNQEPVAWMSHESMRRLREGGNCKGTVPVHSKPSHTSTIPLYTAPPKRKPLTDMQQEMDCYGDGNVYRGQRSSDSKTQTLTINGMPAVEGPLSKAHRTCQESRQVEPVAFIHKNFERRIREVLTEADFGGDKLAFLKYCMSDGNLLPLYTAPPKREPLTEQEIIECVAEVDDARLAGPIAELIRAAERMLGIGGEK